MVKLLRGMNELVWGVPTLVLILGVGLYLSIRTGFFQIVKFPKAWQYFIDKMRPGNRGAAGVSPYQALCTALAATVGTGNIAGVAGAIALGGPGAVFWMWFCAFLGMIVKCAEATLAVCYRQKDAAGDVCGGPMYMIEKGLASKWRPMASLYAFFGVVAAFGVGNATQINSVLSGIHNAALAIGVTVTKKVDIIIGIILAVLILFMLSGGARRIGRIAEGLVPYAACVYLVLCAGALIVRADAIPGALYAIICGAFSPRAVTGGVVCSVFVCCRTGAARGIFTNEAGMGTASIAHASADVQHPVQQGLMGIMEVFLDTIVICTMTALVILCSGVTIPYGTDPGAVLTADAFSSIYGGWASIVIAICLICFALATVLGWGLYGLRCAQYLFGDHIWRTFSFLQAATALLGVVLKTGTVWILAETVNGLMAIPNLITLIMLSPEFFRHIKQYRHLR